MVSFRDMGRTEKENYIKRIFEVLLKISPYDFR